MNTRLYAMISLGMGCFFMLAGILMWVYPPKSLISWGWSSSQMGIFGAMILAYGVFRAWRAYKLLKEL
ncbi:MAG: hypothetical protein ACKVTZ_18695 [Bacteroidia bacterium]